MVEQQPSKLMTRVRFPSPAPALSCSCAMFLYFLFFLFRNLITGSTTCCACTAKRQLLYSRRALFGGSLYAGFMACDDTSPKPVSEKLGDGCAFG